MRPVYITLIIVLGLVAIEFIGRSSIEPKNIVYTMCQESRTTDSVSEETCGELQDYYHVEYLCQENNKNTNNNCWVEVK